MIALLLFQNSTVVPTPPASHHPIELDQLNRLALGPDYSWALVGTPNLRHLWILSRAPKLDTAVLDKLIEQARQLGFETPKLTFTTQDLAAKILGAN